ncbi:MAG: hypothetical protein ACI9IT_000470 [Glaciecola sp.]|jgi:hypothetical protein
MKATNIQHTPLAKLLQSVMAVVVIASLSASATANQINTKLKTPVQVEQALTALLDSRSTNLQLASYTGKQLPVKKIDYSQKSVAELVLAGLAITSEAKYELSAPTTSKEPKPIVIAQDYAVTDIVSVEELDAYQEASALTADASGFTPIEETVNPSSDESNQIPKDITELAVDALPALPAPIAKELNNEIQINDTEVEETEFVGTGFAELETEAPATEFVELEIAETETPETEFVELEIAETKTPETEFVELEIAETETPETEFVELEIAETETPETEFVELEIAETETPETEFVELEIAETETPKTEFAELEIAEIEKVASISNLEEQAPILLASLSTFTQTSPDSISDDTTLNIPETPQVTDNVGANVNIAIRSEGCPENFNKVSIPVNGKLCQIFAADFPASMILFIPQTPEEVVQYYLASSDSFIEPKKIKKRTMLKSADNNTILIISKDGGGTQVDILVKSPVS